MKASSKLEQPAQSLWAKLKRPWLRVNCSDFDSCLRIFHGVCRPILCPGHHHTGGPPTGNRRKGIPAQCFGTPAEFGAVCAFLCSQQAAYITGQNVLVDGGAFPGTF